MHLGPTSSDVDLTLEFLKSPRWSVFRVEKIWCSGVSYLQTQVFFTFNYFQSCPTCRR